MGRSVLVAILAGSVFASAASGGEAAAPIEVAPKVAGTRVQMWPAAAWCEGANCWLVAWTEGFPNEQETDVWCARVSADGRAMDPEGIRLTKAKDIQEEPRVASDGKGFLVVWQDMRNGKDYDVYAARVSGDGKALDGDGFLVAGGERNQVRPDVAAAAGGYFVTWQGYTGEGSDASALPTLYNEKGSGKPAAVYKIYGVRVADGKPAGGGDVPLVAKDGHAFHVTLGSNGTDVVAGFLLASGRSGAAIDEVGVLLVDGAGGKPKGAPVFHPSGALGYPRPCLAWSKGGGVFVWPYSAKGEKSEAAFWTLDASGKPAGSPGEAAAHQAGFIPWISAACDGEKVLVTRDTVGKGKMEVRGQFLPAGKAGALGEAYFLIGDGQQGFASAGPAGTFLVAWAAPRGADDVKVLARMVKAQ